MENYNQILTQTQIFREMSGKEIGRLLLFLKPVMRKYKKGSFIISAGSAVNDLCIVLEGKTQIIKEDIYGNRAIINELGPAEMFAEALACAQIQHSPVSVVSVIDSKILFINFNKIAGAKNFPAAAYNKIIKNIMLLLSQKNIFLNNKLEHASQKTIRDKLLSYFNELAVKSGAARFTIPFSKTAMADYLFVDRSAMSRELAKMKKEKLINFNGNDFEIIKIK